jgi:hypothetical protein
MNGFKVTFQTKTGLSMLYVRDFDTAKLVAKVKANEAPDKLATVYTAIRPIPVYIAFGQTERKTSIFHRIAALFC